jgi:hypothetical protein
MAIITIDQLKARFENGDYPVGSDYVNLIDTIVEVAAGGARITASDTAPASPRPAALWYNTTEGKPYVFYDNFWVELVATVQGPAGATGATGLAGSTPTIAATSPLSYNSGTSTLSLNSSTLFTSPVLTGTPTAPTATTGTSTTQIATTAFVGTAVANLVNSAPAALDTLNELATALGNDPSFATTVTNSIATKANVSHTHAISDVTSLQSSLNAKTDKLQAISAKTGAYSLQATDNQALITCNGTFTITAPSGVFSGGERIDFINIGTGVVTFAGSGVTINSKGNVLTINAQYAAASLVFTSSTQAYLIGSIA